MDTKAILLLAESPPASGRFFYIKGALTTFTARAFEKAHGVTFEDNQAFLNYFKDQGCFLDDVTHTPVDKLSRRDRERILEEGIDPLAERIRGLHPSVIVIVLKRIERFVREAVRRSHQDPVLFVLPYPGMGNQKRYIKGLSEIIRTHLPAKQETQGA